MEKKVYDLIVDEELERVAPPLAENELDLLEADILDRGCRIPLIVWNGIIVDGHNRYSICKKHDIPFTIEEMEFDDLAEAKVWIVKNQLGRRNLKDFQRCEMVLPLENEIRKSVQKKKADAVSSARRGEVKQKLAKPESTRSILAEMAGVSHATLDKVKAIILEADEDTIQKLRTGELKIHTVFSKLRPKDKTEEAPPEVDDDDPVTDDLPEPIIHLDAPIVVPSMREKPAKTSYPFPYVQDQVRFSIENLIRNLEIAVNWLRDEDQDKVDALIDMLDEGFDRAEALLKGQKED